MPRKSKTAIKEELIHKIRKINSEKRKLVILDKEKQYFIRSAEYTYEDDDTIRIPPVIPNIGDTVLGERLFSPKGLKMVLKDEECRNIDVYEDPEDIPLKDENSNNFEDAIVVEVETRITKIFKANTLEELTQVKIENSEENFESIN